MHVRETRVDLDSITYVMSTSGSAEKVSDVAGSFPVPNGTAVLNERLKGSQLHTALKSEPFSIFYYTLVCQNCACAEVDPAPPLLHVLFNRYGEGAPRRQAGVCGRVSLLHHSLHLPGRGRGCR